MRLALVLIPTLNEEEAIGQTVDEVLGCVPECQVLVINGPSTDKTAEIAIQHGAVVINAPRGKGRAVRTTLPYITTTYKDRWIVMLDGDFTYPAKHIPAVLEELERGADAVVGFRKWKAEKSMTRTNKFGNWGLSWMARVLYGVKVKDVCCGLWGFKSEVLQEFTLTSDGFTLEPDLLVNTVRGGYRLAEVPISYRARIGGSLPKLKVRDGFAIGWFLIRSRIG